MSEPMNRSEALARIAELEVERDNAVSAYDEMKLAYNDVFAQLRKSEAERDETFAANTALISRVSDLVSERDDLDAALRGTKDREDRLAVRVASAETEQERLKLRNAELETMVQRQDTALRRAADTFEKLAALDRIIDEKDNKIETILAQIEAHRQKGKPS